MKILRNLSSLALRPFLGDGADNLVRYLDDRLSDHSQRLPRALQTASERAWRALAIALAGLSWWERCTLRFTAADELAFRKQVRAFLEHVPAAGQEQGEEFCKLCLAELRLAHKTHVLPGGQLAREDVAVVARDLTRYDNPTTLVRAEIQAVDVVLAELRGGGFTSLAQYVGLQPAGGQPLLVLAVRYFFRREVESDPRLAASLQYQMLEGLTESQQQGFENLSLALDQHGDRLGALLEDVLEVAKETRDDVRALKEELKALREQLARPALDQEMLRQLQQLQQSYELAVRALQQLQQREEPAPAVVAQAAPAPEENWQHVREMITQYRELAPDQQKQRPALFRAVTRLDLSRPTAEIVAPALAPAEPAAIPSVPPLEEPVKGPLPLSRVFQQPAAETSKTPTLMPKAAPGLLSPLFQKKAPEEESAPAPEKPAQAPSKLLSPLFHKKPSEQG